MTRALKETYDLCDAEKRDLIALIQQGKALPEKCRFVLFECKREVEPVWNGKTRDVCTTILPFQTLEQIDEPRTETHGSGPQEDLLAVDGSIYVHCDWRVNAHVRECLDEVLGAQQHRNEILLRANAHNDPGRFGIIADIFENEWQSFRTRLNRELDLTTTEHTYDKAGRYTVAVKVIDIFGNDTMTLVPVGVG